MALNLSRNTKVFVSSANGIPTAGGGILTAYISTAGTGYAVGDIVTLGTTSASGANAKCIVLSIGGSGAVATISIPNNFRGNGFAAAETATETAVESFAGVNNSGASGLVLTVLTVTGTTTAEGARTGTGRFKGNETTANTFVFLERFKAIAFSYFVFESTKLGFYLLVISIFLFLISYL